ncbi:MAG: chorismate mutase [Clostridium sp.]
MEDLSWYRKEIDEIDKELTSLFERRMDVVLKVAKYKKENNMEIFNKSREEQVIEKNIGYLNNPEYSEGLKDFFNSTMEISRAIQYEKIHGDDKAFEVSSTIDKNAIIGFQGVLGSFSEEALLKYFGTGYTSKSYEEFEDVFKGIQNGEINYGVLPIENSSTGAISEVYDLLRKYGFYIVGEEFIRIDQHLIGIEGSIIEEVDEVYSHPQGFEQSSEFLKTYDHWKRIPFHNTAISAKLIADLRDKTKAAIASKRAADIYGLSILKECINNQKENFTKFIIIGKNIEMQKGADKVSVVFSLEDKAGTLFKLLKHFAENNINLIKIESRPIKDNFFKYFLYLDFEGTIKDKAVIRALNLVEGNSAYFKLLGCYKKIENEG